jgi:small subunit ribosomal protein S17
MFNKGNKKINKRYFEGIVISDKMNQTRVVEVIRFKTHPLYKKRYKVFRHYKIDDKNNESKEGDKVLFEECRPISKDKKWRLIKILKHET